MKFGARTPSIKKSVKARTTGKINRQVKRSVVPLYGKKGTGIIKNPKKAVYNKVYNKTTISVVPPLIGVGTSSKPKTSKSTISYHNQGIIEAPQSNKVTRRYISVFTKWEKYLLLYMFISFIIGLFITPILALYIIITIVFIYKEFHKDQFSVIDNLTGERIKISKIEYKKLEQEYKEQKLKYSKIALRDQLALYDRLMHESITSSEIMETTTDPKEFFDNYDFILNRADKLIELVKDPRLKNDGSDFVNLKLKMVENRPGMISDLIERIKIHVKSGLVNLKTDRGKENRIKKSQGKILEFSDNLSESQKTYVSSWELNNF